MRIVSDESCRKNQKDILYSVTFFFFENPAVYEIMLKHTVERIRSQMTTWCIHITCWIPRDTNTHSQYVILIAFHSNNGCTNAPHCYVIRTLPILFIKQDSLPLLKFLSQVK